MSFESFVALRYLRARGGQAFISLITIISMAGVALGVCALVVVLSVMGGFELELKNKILGMNAQVTLMSLDGPMADAPEVLKLARADKQVLAAGPYVQGQVMIVSASGAKGAMLRGVDLDPKAQVLELDKLSNRPEGALAALGARNPDNLPNIMLGGVLARNLRLRMGEVITVVNPIGEETPVGRAPKSEYFRFVGTIDSGLYQYDANVGFAELKSAQEFFNLGGAVSGVELRVDDIYQAGNIGMRLSKALGFRYFYRDWMSSNHSLLAALKLEKVTMFVILTLIVLVAAFGIVSSLIMLVMKKTRDIGILKAMGATNKSVWRIFVLMGGIIGLIGSLAGLAIGCFLCWLLGKYKFIDLPADIYALGTLPVQMDPPLISLVGALAVVICLLATLYPAWVASRLDPVEALRYQ